MSKLRKSEKVLIEEIIMFDYITNDNIILENYKSFDKSKAIQEFFKLPSNNISIIHEGIMDKLKNMIPKALMGYLKLAKDALKIATVLGIGVGATKLTQAFKTFKDADLSNVYEPVAQFFYNTYKKLGVIKHAPKDVATKISTSSRDVMDRVQAHGSGLHKPEPVADPLKQLARNTTSSVMTPITQLLYSINYVVVHSLVAMGIQKEVAEAIAPYIDGAIVSIGVVVLYKLFKLIIGFIKSLVAKFKSNSLDKNKANEKAKKMASISIKMQESNISKIKNSKYKQLELEKLKKKKEKLR